MQYAVPQFIDAEDKLIGPLSLKQFGIVFAAAIIDLIIFKLFGVGFVLIILGVPILLIGVGIAFIPFNGRQIYQMFPLFISYLTEPKLYIFRHVAPSIQSMHIQKQVKDGPTKTVDPASLESPQSALKRLSLALDQKHEEESDLIGSPYRKVNNVK